MRGRLMAGGVLVPVAALAFVFTLRGRKRRNRRS